MLYSCSFIVYRRLPCVLVTTDLLRGRTMNSFSLFIKLLLAARSAVTAASLNQIVHGFPELVPWKRALLQGPFCAPVTKSFTHINSSTPHNSPVRGHLVSTFILQMEELGIRDVKSLVQRYTAGELQSRLQLLCS